MNIPNAIRPLSEEEKAQNHPYRVGALLSATSSIPSKKTRMTQFPLSWVINQGAIEAGNDECGGCSAALISGLQEGTQLDPHFHWMMARERSNMGLNDYGVGNVDLAKTLQKVGSLKKEDSPLDFKDGRDKIATPAFWDIVGLLPKALPQKKGSYLWVKAENGMDAYDMFRSSVIALEKKYAKPHGAVFGLTWGYGNEYLLTHPVESGSGHDVAVLGEWDGDYVTMVNSYGTSIGYNGEQQLHRSIINRWAEVYGMFIPIDATPEEVKLAIENGTKLDANWLMNIIMSLLSFTKDLLAQLKAKTYGIFTH